MEKFKDVGHQSGSPKLFSKFYKINQDAQRCMYIFFALPVSGAWLSVALPIWGAVTGVWISSTRRRGATWGRGVTGAGLIASTGLGGGNSRLGGGGHVIISRLGSLRGVILWGEGPRWVLLGALGWCLLLASKPLCWGSSLRCGRGVVLELLLLLWGSGLRGVTS